MKANAPEKIWLDSRSVFLNKPNKSGLTEYARTDAFIAKAKLWLAEIHRVCDITDEHGYRIELRELQARFENYMKGE